MGDGPRDRTVEVMCLLDSLRAAQSAVTGYDNKAQIVGIGFVFSINAIWAIGSGALASTQAPVAATLGSLVVVLTPLILFGYVLCPSRGIKLLSTTKYDGIRDVYFFHASATRGLQDYVDDVEQTDWPREIAFEIMKVSAIRDAKHRRFMRALYCAAASYLFIFAWILVRLV